MNWENTESKPGHTEPLGRICCPCRLSWVLVVAELSSRVCTVLFKLAIDLDLWRCFWVVSGQLLSTSFLVHRIRQSVSSVLWPSDQPFAQSADLCDQLRQPVGLDCFLINQWGYSRSPRCWSRKSVLPVCWETGKECKTYHNSAFTLEIGAGRHSLGGKNPKIL